MNIFEELFVVLWRFSKSIFFAIVYTFIPSPKKSIDGEIALVTGAGSGIGRLVALRLADKGCTVVLWDINKQGNEETKGLIEQKGGRAHAYCCDMSNKSEIEKVSQKVKSDVGDVNILVNNAGIVSGMKLLDTPDDMITRTMNVNLMSHFWTIKAFLPAMLEFNLGHIVSISSMLGISGLPGVTDYGASKAGVMRLTESIEEELRCKNNDRTIKCFVPSMVTRDHGHIVNVASMAGIVGCSRLVDYCTSKFGDVGLTEALDYELTSEGHGGVKTTVVCPYQIDTGMFDGCSRRFEWLMPMLKPEYVADRIIYAILTNQKVLMLPRSMYIMNMLKTILPIEAQTQLHKFLGASNFMDTFKGRAKSE